MAYQLVFTSAPAGLVAGRSGFCTVARHRDVPEGLIGHIESFANVYDRGALAGGDEFGLPVIYSHRIIGAGSKKFHVLSRVRDAGSDYSGRVNHIAHCLIIEESEARATKVTPAEVMAWMDSRKRWLDRWAESHPRFFEKNEVVHLDEIEEQISLPAETWKRSTGHAECAAAPFELAGPEGCNLVFESSTVPDEILKHIGESLLVKSPSRDSPAALWNVSFTTHLQASDQRSDFQWAACLRGSPAHARTAKGNRRAVEANRSLTPPSGELASRAADPKFMAPLPKPDLVVPEPDLGHVGPTTPAPDVRPDQRPLERASSISQFEYERQMEEHVSRKSGGARGRRGFPKWLIAAWAVLVLLVIFGIFRPKMLDFINANRLEGALEKSLEGLKENINNGNWDGARKYLGQVQEGLDGLDKESRKKYSGSPAISAAQTVGELQKLQKNYSGIPPHEKNLEVYLTGVGVGRGLPENHDFKKVEELKAQVHDAIQKGIQNEIDQFARESRESFLGSGELDSKRSDRLIRQVQLLTDEKIKGEKRSKLERLSQWKDVASETIELKRDLKGSDSTLLKEGSAKLSNLRSDIERIKSSEKDEEEFRNVIYRILDDAENGLKKRRSVVTDTKTKKPGASGGGANATDESTVELTYPALPRTYITVRNDEHSYDISNIRELQANPGEYLTVIHDSNSILDPRISRPSKDSRKEIGNGLVIRDQNHFLEPVFEIEENVTGSKVLRRSKGKEDKTFDERFGGGFLIRFFSNKESPEPYFQILAYDPTMTNNDMHQSYVLSENANKFIELRDAAVLNKSGVEYLNSLRFASNNVKAALVLRAEVDGNGKWKGESVPVDEGDLGFAELKLYPGEGVNSEREQRLTQIKAKIAKNQFLTVGEKKFQDGLAQAGAKLKEGMEKIEKKEGNPPQLKPVKWDSKNWTNTLSEFRQFTKDKNKKGDNRPDIVAYLEQLVKDVSGPYQDSFELDGKDEEELEFFDRFGKIERWDARAYKTHLFPKLLRVANYAKTREKLATPKPERARDEDFGDFEEKWEKWAKNKNADRFFENWAKLFTSKYLEEILFYLVHGAGLESGRLNKEIASLETEREKLVQDRAKEMEKYLKGHPSEWGNFFIELIVESGSGSPAVVKLVRLKGEGSD